MYKTIILILILKVLSISFAQENCIENDESVPLCPNSGSTLLDETYPTRSFVISTTSFSKELNKVNDIDVGLEVPTEFINQVMNSYPIENNRPEIIVPTDEGSFNALVESLRKKFQNEGLSEEQIQSRLAQIKHSDVRQYTWQQDFFESFVDLETGQPQLRAIASYDATLRERLSIGVDKYTQAIQQKMTCVDQGRFIKGHRIKGVKRGFVTKAQKSASEGRSHLLNRISNRSWGAGEMGGNIEALPGGICLKGNNTSTNFMGEFCGGEDNLVEIDVGWLKVGHVDELIKVVPIHPKVEPAECSFTVMVASPQKGLEIMEDPEYRPRAFIEEDNDDSTKFDQIFEHLKQSGICYVLNDYENNSNQSPSRSGSGAGNAVQAFLQNSISNLSFNAYANEDSEEEQKLNDKDCKRVLRNITNAEMASLMRNNHDFNLTNRLVQEKMNKAKEDMRAKLAERMPQCSSIQFKDVPNLFYNRGGFAEINGEEVLPQPGIAGSLFPNPTNSVLANKTMIISETPSFTFNDYFKDMLKDQGINSSFVDTWNYSHRGDGNIHCSSHSIPYCRPRGGSE